MEKLKKIGKNWEKNLEKKFGKKFEEKFLGKNWTKFWNNFERIGKNIVCLNWAWNESKMKLKQDSFWVEFKF